MASPTPAVSAANAGSTPQLHLAAQMDSDGSGVAVHLAGELDVVTAPWLLDRMSDALTPSDRKVSLDLSALTFVDVAGVRAVAAIDDVLKQAAGKLEVRGLQGGPLRAARLLGLDLSLEG